MKVVTVVGARPQFVKCAPVSRELRRAGREVLVHTGQHYDENMDAVFFRELDIPRPDYRLGVGSGTHAEQTGRMLLGVERVLLREKPDVVLVYGDTNSTLAGALAAAKLRLPVAHVEAGLRSFNRAMPEEINRIVTDRLSTWLFCPTRTAVRNLAREGIREGVHETGDVMLDSLRFNAALAGRSSPILRKLKLKPGGYCLATVHRAENTDKPRNLKNLLAAFAGLIRRGERVVFPMHPRTRRAWRRLGLRAPAGLEVIAPVSYLDMLQLEQKARSILTDSGGVQKEAFWLQVPCTTLRGETEWVETLARGWNVLAGTDPGKIARAALRPRPRARGSWSGAGASRAIVDLLMQGA